MNPTAESLLASLLRSRSTEADGVARTLAPDGPGPGRRFQEDASSRPVAYQAKFREIEELAVLVAAAHPGALVFALEVLAELDPEAALPAVATLIMTGPNAALGAALSRVLGRTASEHGFRLLIDHPAVPYLRRGLATQGWPGGVSEAWALLQQVDFFAPALDPHSRDRTLPALSYLLRHDPGSGFAAARTLLPAPHANLYVAHLLGRMEPQGRDVLVEDLLSAPLGGPLRFSQRLGLKILFERDVLRVVDTLGGEERLRAPEARPRLLALLDWLRSDTWARPQDGGSRGWLAADLRIIRLVAELKADSEREVAGLARDLLATLPKDTLQAALPPKPSRTPAKSPARSRPVQPPPDPQLLTEMEAIRLELEGLVARLRSSGYRFAAPKAAYVPPRRLDLAALDRLEKRVVVPPVLATFWRVVGSVDLRGHDPHWARPAFLGFSGVAEPVWLTDPLVIAPAASVVTDALEEGLEPPLSLVLGPDALAGAGYSAGVRTLALPQKATDPTVIGLERPLLAHLRFALAWGGFPGFVTLPDRPDSWIAKIRPAIPLHGGA